MCSVIVSRFPQREPRRLERLRVELADVALVVRDVVFGDDDLGRLARWTRKRLQLQRKRVRATDTRQILDDVVLVESPQPLFRSHRLPVRVQLRRRICDGGSRLHRRVLPAADFPHLVDDDFPARGVEPLLEHECGLMAGAAIVQQHHLHAAIGDGFVGQAFEPFGVRELELVIFDGLEREVLLDLLACSDRLFARRPVEAHGLRPHPVLAVVERREVVLPVFAGPHRGGHGLARRPRRHRDAFHRLAISRLHQAHQPRAGQGPRRSLRGCRSSIHRPRAPTGHDARIKLVIRIPGSSSKTAQPFTHKLA